MKHFITALACVVGGLIIVSGETPGEARLQGQLRKVFPGASSFSAKEGQPPHFTAYVQDPETGKPTTAGYAFWTTELEPLERGYDGPIKMMIGLNLKGVITGLLVVEHHEPYGNFSVEPPQFAEHFKGKSIRDPFKIGVDIDAISRATITMTSAARAIKNSSRRVARQLLSPEAVK